MKTNVRSLFILSALSVALVAFLFYLDEGLNSWAWVQDPGIWLVFGIYAMATFLGSFAVYRLFRRRFSELGSCLAGSFLGGGLGFFFMALAFYYRMH